MIDLKKLLTCGLALVLAMGATGCDEEGECDEAGVCTDGGPIGGNGGDGGDGGNGGGGDGGDGGNGGGTEYNVVIIDDTSGETAANGTPGVDICGVQANCGGSVIAPIGAQLGAGEGFICGEGTPPAGITCATDRNNANAVLNYGSCDASSNPSDYVSLGTEGTLTVTFGRDLQGCTIQILEATGGVARDESAVVAVCSDASGNDCLTVNGSAEIGNVDEGDSPASIAVPTL